MQAGNDVLFDELSGHGGDVAVITLNRPQVLNSLNHVMVEAMYAQLQTWASKPTIKAVVIRAAEGRAFCAGGDLRLTHERFQTQTADRFFYDEYQLNKLIHHFPKPYIAFLDGITMGGGVGISIHGSHRVATERLLFAMPETGIGFFPDVGGTYFLPRLPGYQGYYLGLVGTRIASDECVALGIAQCKVARESLTDILDQLVKQDLGQHPRERVTEILSTYQLKLEASSLLENQEVIDDCFSAPTMEEIVNALQQSPHAIAKEASLMLAKKSPTSLKISLQAFQSSKQLDFDACMRQEYRLACRFVDGHDFREGIRAVIIDKDQTPHWQPATLPGVTAPVIKKYFSPLAKELA